MKILTINDGLVIKLTAFLEPSDVKELMLANKDMLQKISENPVVKNRMLVFELRQATAEIKVESTGNRTTEKQRAAPRRVANRT